LTSRLAVSLTFQTKDSHMPGQFELTVFVYPCFQYDDGTVGYCDSVEYAKVPFALAAENDDHPVFGWRPEGSDRIAIPLERVAASLRDLGVSVEFDPDEVKARIDSQRPNQEEDPAPL
jgi:hypothetical protein